MNNLYGFKKRPHYNFVDDVRYKWYILNAHNIRTIRDIFVYSYYNKNILEEDLYSHMEMNIIPPPKGRWVNHAVKKNRRIRLDYVNAAE